MFGILRCGDRDLDLATPQVMGVLNITPDSFSDGGNLYSATGINWDALMQRAETMIVAGATILDVGGESTRPGSSLVATEEQCARVVPVIKRLAELSSIVISVDTSDPAVMRAAADAGAGMLNDIRALREEGALATAASLSLPVCLGHIGGSGKPATMQEGINHNDMSVSDIMHELQDFFKERINSCLKAGIDMGNMILDPGFGFGKRDIDNLHLIESLDDLIALDKPVMVGVSRKSTIGRLLNKTKPYQCLVGGITLGLRAIQKGAILLRSHDVAETMDMIRMWQALSSTADHSRF